MIHPTAVISAAAHIDPTAEIGPWCVIDGPVHIGPGTVLMNGVAVYGDVRIGADNHIGAHTAIGGRPQDPSYQNEATRVEIGHRNQIFEYVSIHRGTVRGDGCTRLGDDNMVMAYSHLAHDVQVGSGSRITAYCGISGHCQIGDHAVISGMVGLQQFVRVGAYAFVSGHAAITQDVLPYSVAFGTACPAYLHGVNLIGLERHGLAKADLHRLRQVMQLWKDHTRTAQSVLEQLRQQWGDQPQVRDIIAFAEATTRGVLR